MYYSKEELEKLRIQGEEHLKKQKEEAKGHPFASAAGLQITCLHCKNERFLKGSALLNTRGLTFFDLDWLNDSAITLTCTQCGHIHWFAKDVRQMG